VNLYLESLIANLIVLGGVLLMLLSIPALFLSTIFGSTQNIFLALSLLLSATVFSFGLGVFLLGKSRQLKYKMKSGHIIYRG